MELNSAKIKSIMSDVEKALKEVESKHGVELDFGSVKYGSNEFRTTMNATYFGKEKPVDDVKKEKFEQGATIKGVNLDYYGKEFNQGRKRLKVVGINTRASVNFIELEDVNTGTKYKCNKSMLESLVK